MATDLSYIKAGYKSERWKWVFKLPEKEKLLSNSNLICEALNNSNLLQTYGLDKPPKVLPCRKKCTSNPWCLASISKENKSNSTQLTEQLRDMGHPIGLQNTANTCWINSALQALFHLNQFRNCINSIEGFQAEKSLSSLEFLLQAIFVEMELHKNKALACSTDSVFEKLAVFVSKEIMQKDQDFEVLKCVSEFLENTIDSLLGNPRTGPQFSPLFKTTLYRVAKWKCSSCQMEHVRQLPPDTCYTMAAYVSADECPLNQCILDLQTETQTGVSLVCGMEDASGGGGGGCGATVKVDRVVTPQILSLPSLLIIRNNSLIDREIKRRLHVVYPETLDLTSHTCNQEASSFSLRAVIYHHGHWIKHFSAHVKTEEGKWFNFNDEKVSELVRRPGNCNPLENHKDYFSLANVANKYKNRSRMRVSRGAFIWIYERNSAERANSLIQPPNAVLDYVLAKQKNKQSADVDLIEKRKKERLDFYEEMSLENLSQESALISRPLLSAWYNYEDVRFVPQPSLLAEGICEHIKFDPTKINFFKCIRQDKVASLLNADFGIASDGKIPLTYSREEAFCKQCVSRHSHHILFRENLKELHKKAKKETSKEMLPGTTFIGTTTLGKWMKLALNVYVKEVGLEDTENALEEESDGAAKAVSDGNEEENGENKPGTDNEDELPKVDSTKSNGELKELPNPENGTKENGEDSFNYFNEDIVCCHNMIDPKEPGVWLPDQIFEEMKRLCAGLLHPAMLQNDFAVCMLCKNDLNQALETCSKGKLERKNLYHLFVERKRPQPLKDAGKTLFLLSRDFFADWKAFVRLCVKEDQEPCRPTDIKNSDLICKHNKLLYPGTPESPLLDFAVLLWEEEWNILKENYTFDHCIEVCYSEDKNLIPVIGICEEGCVEEEAERIYEEQFHFEYELINIRQVNSVTDVPRTNTPEVEETGDLTVPKKKPRLATTKENSGGLASLRTASQRLVRASKTFSSSDTIKEVQNFIADRTGIWPLLQTLWLSGGKEHGPQPLVLTDQHRSMTLNALRVKPGDTIYFRAAVEDMEKAAGDGEAEYSEIVIGEGE